MKFNVNLSLAVVCEKPYAVMCNDGCMVCIPCKCPITHNRYTVYLELDEYYTGDPAVGTLIAYEWNHCGRRVYIPDGALSVFERGGKDAYEKALFS